MSVGTRRKTSNPCKQIDTKGSLGPVPLSSAAGAGMLSPFGYLIKDNMRKEDLLLKFQSLIAAKHTSALQGRPNTAVRSSGRSQQQHHHALNALNRTFGHASSAGKEMMMMTDQQYYLDQVRTPERKKSKRKKALRRQSLCETQNDAEVSRGDEEALTTTATTKKEYKISPIKKKKKKTIESDPQDNEGVVVLTDQITMNQGEFTSPQAVAITAKDTSNAPGSQVLISNRSSVKNKSARRGGNDQSSKQYEIQDYNQAENAENVTPFSVQHQNLMKCEDQSERQGDRIIGRDTKPSGDDNDVYGEEENEEESNDMRSINSSKKKSIPRRYDKLREILESRNEELEKMKLAMCGCISRVKQIRIKHFSQVSLHESNQIHPSFESELALLEQCIVVLLQQVAMKSITKGTAGAQQQSLQQQQSQITIPQDIQKALAQSELLTKEAAREKEWLCGRLREKERMVEELLKALSASNSDVEVLSSEVAQLRKQEEKIRKELEQMKKNTQQQESEQEEDQKDKEKLLKKCKELQEKEGIARETNIELQLQLETSLGYLIRENDTLHREINILKGRKGNEEIIQGKQQQQSGNGSTQKNDGEQKQKEMGRLQVSSPKESLITQHQVQQQPQKLQQFSQDQRKFIVPQRRGSLKENTTNDHKANNGSQRQTVSLRQMASDGAGIESDSESKEKIIMLNQQDVAIIPNQNRSAKKKNSVDQQQSEEKVKQQQQIVDSEKKVGIQGRDKKNSFNYGDNNDDIQKSHFTFQQEQQFSQGSRGSSSKKEIINENRFQRDMLNQSGIIGSQKELMQEFEQITAGKQERSDNKRNSLQRELDQQEGDDYEHDDDNSSSSGQGDEEEEKERKSTIRSSQHGDNRLNDQLGDESMYGDVSNYSSDTMQKDNKQKQYSQTPKRSRNNNMLSSEGRKDMKDENTNQSDRRKSNNGLVIGNSNEDISKQRKSTRSFGGDNNNDNGKDGGDNDSNNTEYLTFERSQHEGEGEHEQQQQQQGYNSREYQQLKEYFSNDQQHQLQLIEAEAVEKQLFEQVNNNRSRQSESQSSKNSLADSHSQMGKRTGQFGGQNSQGEIAVNNSRGSEQRILQIEQISEKKGEEVIKI